MKICHISDLRPGMIGLSGGPGFVQKAIKWFTRSQYAHSFSVLGGPYSVISCIETTSTLIHVVPLERKLLEPDFVDVWEPVADIIEKEAALRKTFIEYSGYRYGYESYLWFMYRSMLRRVGLDAMNMWPWAEKGTTCTELTCFYLKNINSQFDALFKNRDFNTYSPAELYDLIKENSSMFNLVGRLV